MNEYISPWVTTIGQKDFSKDELDVEALLEEALMSPTIMESQAVGSLRVNKRDFPKNFAAIDQHLRAQLKEYALQIGYDLPKHIKWSAWFHFCMHGNGLEPHYHMGDAQLTSVLYLTDSSAALVMRDPRNNFVRNFPKEIRDKHNADLRIIPKQGRSVVFPVYVDHYVMPFEKEFRVSLAVDWTLK